MVKDSEIGNIAAIGPGRPPALFEIPKTRCQSMSGLGASVRTSESCERCPVGRRERWDRSIPKAHSGERGVHDQTHACRVKSSTTVRMRKRRPMTSVSITKSSDQRRF